MCAGFDKIKKRNPTVDFAGMAVYHFICRKMGWMIAGKKGTRPDIFWEEEVMAKKAVKKVGKKIESTI